MFRSRLSKFVGALLCSFGLVVGGAFQVLPANAADGDPINVTVRVVDAETGALVNTELSYYSSKRGGDVTFNNGETISIDELDMYVDNIHTERNRTEISAVRGTETYAKYDLMRGDYGCYASPEDAGSTVTCQAVKLPHKTTLKALDKDTGEVVPLTPNDVFRLSPDGKTYYYTDDLKQAGIAKPGYLGVNVKIDNLVENGETVVTLEKAPTREVTFTFIDALNGKELTGTEAELFPTLRRFFGEKYSIANGQTLTFPNYDPYAVDTWWLRLVTSTKAGWGDAELQDPPYIPSVNSRYNSPLLRNTTVEVPTVHVRVVDEAGNPVEGATVHIDDTFIVGFANEDTDVFSANTIENRGEDKTSGAEDVVYVALYNSPIDNGCDDDDGCYVEASKVVISVQANGYETPTPVTFLHSEDNRDVYNALGMTLDNRVKYTSREVSYTLYGEPSSYTEILGETVTITLTKKAADPTPSADPTTPTPSPDPTDKGKDGKQAGAVNDLVATGSSVGIGLLTAVLFIGTGLLLRRKLMR